MFPAGDVGGAVGTFTVADGEVDDLAVEFGGAEDQVKISEGVEVAEVGTVGGNFFVLFFPHHFCAAEGVFNGLAEHP